MGSKFWSLVFNLRPSKGASMKAYVLLPLLLPFLLLFLLPTKIAAVSDLEPSGLEGLDATVKQTEAKIRQKEEELKLREKAFREEQEKREQAFRAEEREMLEAIRSKQALIDNLKDIVNELRKAKGNPEKMKLISRIGVFIDKLSLDLSLTMTSLDSEELQEIAIRALGLTYRVRIDGYHKYTLKKGDNLWNLGREELIGIDLGKSTSLWVLIFEKNKQKYQWVQEKDYQGFSDWVMIERGQVIEIPSCTRIE